MNRLFSSILLFSGCSLAINSASDYNYCGNVDVLTVYVKNAAFMDCKEALQITNDAYELLWQKAAGPLHQSWRVEYTWGAIDITGAWAKTDPQERRIMVQSAAAPSIFHELLHAYMMETHTGGRNQHRTMCENKLWRQLEKDFGVKPYCYQMYF